MEFLLVVVVWCLFMIAAALVSALPPPAPCGHRGERREDAKAEATNSAERYSRWTILETEDGKGFMAIDSHLIQKPMRTHSRRIVG